MRLDNLLVEKYNIKSRSYAASLIMAGDVSVNGLVVTKAGYNVKNELFSSVIIKNKDPYVGFGAYKLLKALEFFSLNVNGLICIDVGSSTGGFTQVLLQNGAKLVYAVDVGENQLEYTLRTNPQVIVYEKTNARVLDESYFKQGLPEFFGVDVSFISLKLIIPVLSRLNIKKGVVLIKPQFEVGKEIKNFDGIVKEEKYQTMAIEKVVEYAEQEGYKIVGVTESPTQGEKKNKEFLAYLVKEESPK